MAPVLRRRFHDKQATANHMRLSANGLSLSLVLLAILSFPNAGVHAQASGSSTQTAAAAAQELPGTSTDLFVMGGSDFDRPGLVPRANYNIGIGHTFGFLKKDPVGDELTFGYTYENSGTHGFFYSGFGEHTESAGVMKNFSLPKRLSCPDTPGYRAVLPAIRAT